MNRHLLQAGVRVCIPMIAQQDWLWILLPVEFVKDFMRLVVVKTQG